MIRLGRIAYVNMAPVFYRVEAEVEEVQGVPTELNRMHEEHWSKCNVYGQRVR